MSTKFKGKFGPLLIAEIGGNHEGDFEYAKHLTRLAIQSNVDMVKFQIYSSESLVSELESPDRSAHFKKFELTQEQHIELATMVSEAGLLYSASVWNIDSLDWIDNYINIYKVGSGDLTAYPLLKAIAGKNKPIILSTGLATEEEVLDSVRYIQSCNPLFNEKEMLALLQCTSMYPIRFADANLSVIPRLKHLTGLTIGYSDHTEGMEALKYATVLGAEILEFHFTDSREGKIFRDHKVSLTPVEIKVLVEQIKKIKELLGDPVKKPMQIEIDNGHVISFRRAVYPSKEIKKGECLSSENLTVLRPNHGIDARDFEELIGKRINKLLEKHKKLNWNDLGVNDEK